MTGPLTGPGVALLALLAGTSPAGAGTVAPLHPTLRGQFVVGFQGWFMCPHDGRPNGGWWHWFTANRPDAEHVHFDLLPDTSELTPEERCPTDLKDRAGRPIFLFSDQNPKTVRRQFEWMRDYGIDAAALQRFVVDIDPVHPVAGRPAVDQVLHNALDAAAATGRGLLVMYDIAGADPDRWADTLADDWQRLLAEGVTRDPAWQYHRGRPVLAIAGIGADDRPGTAEQTLALFARLRRESEPFGGVTLLGSTATGWRTLDHDSKRDPAWRDVYAALDVISPWTVGRYRDEAGYRRYVAERLRPDIEAARARGMDAMPVIFPGFSWRNLQHAAGRGEAVLNHTPRRGGRFLWMQATGAADAGATMLYGAMFDEVDEGTALFKLRADPAALPEAPPLVRLDQDGEAVAGDAYLAVAGRVGVLLKQKMASNPDALWSP